MRSSVAPTPRLRARGGVYIVRRKTGLQVERRHIAVAKNAPTHPLVGQLLEASYVYRNLRSQGACQGCRVLRQIGILKETDFRLRQASAILIRQSTPHWRSSTSVAYPAISGRNPSKSPMRLPGRHRPVFQFSASSATFVQLPCFGEFPDAMRRAKFPARAGSKAELKSHIVCPLSLFTTKVTCSQPT